MSSDIDRRACVTTCTDSGRREWLILTLPRYAHPPTRREPRPDKPPRSAGLAHRGHVETLDPNRRHRGAVEVVAPFARQRRHGGADFEQPLEHADRRLVEPEVVDRADDLAAFHQVDAVPGEPGEQQG